MTDLAHANALSETMIAVPENRLTADVLRALMRPFDWALIGYLPGDVNQDHTHARAMPYVSKDTVAWRLNEVVPGDWSDSYRIIHESTRRIVVECSLTVCGITRIDVGEAGADDKESFKQAYSDAFKRAACRFGVASYLSFLDPMYFACKTRNDGKFSYWSDYDGPEKGFRTAYPHLAPATDLFLPIIPKVVFTKNGKTFSPSQAPIVPTQKQEPRSVDPERPLIQNTVKPVTPNQAGLIGREVQRTGVTASQLHEDYQVILNRPLEEWSNKGQQWASKLIDHLRSLPSKSDERAAS